MSINLNTVTSKAVRLKAPNGIYHEATAVVYKQSNGEAVFSLTKPLVDADKGIWEVYTSEQNRIADAAGNLLILNEKIGEFEVTEPEATAPTTGRTLYTVTTTTNAIAGDSIFIDGEGDIQLPTAPTDGSEFRIFDPNGKIKAGKNNCLLGTGDRWTMADGSFSPTPLEFDDNHLRRGMMILKYSAPTKSWRPYVVYGATSPSSVETSLSRVQHDAGELLPLPISSTPSVQFHLEGGAGAWVDAGLPDGWWGTVLNTTNNPQPILFDDTLQVYVRDGKPLALATSPYLVPANSSATLQMVENGFKFLQIIPQGGSGVESGDRIESIPLGTLQAGTWTPFPSATGAIKDFKIFDSAGNDISSLLETRRPASGWEVFSLVPQDDLFFEYEIVPTGNSKIEKVVLPWLAANVWTNLPAAKGAIADFKIFDSDVDISDLLDIRRINGIYQARSLVDLVDLQVEYEIGA